jgi:hypothetical protein
MMKKSKLGILLSVSLLLVSAAPSLADESSEYSPISGKSKQIDEANATATITLACQDHGSVDLEVEITRTRHGKRVSTQYVLWNSKLQIAKLRPVRPSDAPELQPLGFTIETEADREHPHKGVRVTASRASAQISENCAHALADYALTAEFRNPASVKKNAITSNSKAPRKSEEHPTQHNDTASPAKAGSAENH